LDFHLARIVALLYHNQICCGVQCCAGVVIMRE